MNDKEAFELKKAKLEKIAVPDTHNLHHIPGDVYAQEADALHHWAKADEETLKHRGLDWELVEDLPVRAGAFREAQTLWYLRKNTPKEMQKEWKQFFPKVKAFKNELIESYRYAFREKPNLLLGIKDNLKKTGAVFVIQSLVNLSVMGRNNVELLEKIGFDMAQFDRLEAFITEAEELRAEAVISRKRPTEEKILRDRAYTHLKEAVDAIRKCGKFAFRKDEERLVGYRSEYLHKKNLKRSRKNKKSTE